MTEVKDFTPKSEDEIRQQVIEDYDLDPDDDANKPFIEKATKKELAWQDKQVEFSKKELEAKEKLSKAIQQKTEWRDKAKKALEDEPEAQPNDKPNSEPEPKAPEAPKQDDEKVSKLEKDVEDLKNSQQRQKYSHLTDEEFTAINNLAKADGKSFEETMTNNPLAKTYMETNKINDRVREATAAPSNRTTPSDSKSFEQIDLGNPEDVKWLKSDPKRKKEYDDWMEREGSKNLTH